MLANQVLGAGDEIAETVMLEAALTLFVPTSPELASTASVGDGIDEAPVQKAQTKRRELRLYAIAIGAVPVQERGMASIPLQSIAIDER